MAAERAAFRSLLRICRQADKQPSSLLSLVGWPPRMYNISQNREVRMLYPSSPFAEEMVWEASGRSTQFAHPRPGKGEARRACRQHRARALYMGIPYLKEAQDLYQRFNESIQVMAEIESQQVPDDVCVETGPAGIRHVLKTFDPMGQYQILPGDFLLTHPIACMSEPVFDQAVAILHKNSDHPLTDSGVVHGLVLNKRLNTSFRELLERAQDPQDKAWSERLSTSAIAENLSVYRGGPVIVGSSLQANLDWVHGFPDITDARPICEGIWIGGNIDEILEKAAACNDAEPPVRIMLGYSAWSTLQLQIELECGIWCRARAMAEPPREMEPGAERQDISEMLCFHLEGADAWRTALLCADKALFANFPRASGTDARMRGFLKRHKVSEPHP